MMWGDRLIDGDVLDYGEWEASKNGTAPAIDLIPRDIIICDWHYEVRESYPSVPMFIEKGFQVLPTSWRKVDASRTFIEYGQSLNDPAVLGHLFTRWTARRDSLAYWPPLAENAPVVRKK